MRRTHALALLLATTPLLVGCGSDAGGVPADEPDPDTRTAASTDDAAPEDLQVVETATDLLTPWGLAPLRDGGLLIGSRDTGDIWLLEAGSSKPHVVGHVDGVRAEGESGLLGLAMTRDEKALYAYRAEDTENGVLRLSWDGTTLGAPEQILSGIPGGEVFHQGGALAIGPDDLLYVGTGDNGVPPNAQDPDSLSGKVLRYTLDGEPAPDNPSGTAVLSLGHRNIEGLVFDDAGRLWESEFGQDTYDELNLIVPGANYGWPVVEGTGNDAAYTNPSAVWHTDDASPAGIAWWDGSLWLAALQGKRVWEVRPDAAAASGPPVDTVAAPVGHLTGRYGRIRNTVSSADGSTLWVVTSNTDGRGDPDADDDRLLSITR